MPMFLRLLWLSLFLSGSAFPQALPQPIVYPADKSTGIPTSTLIAVYTPPSGTPSAISVTANNVEVPGTVVTPIRNWIVFTPNQSLSPNVTYSLTVSSAGTTLSRSTFTTTASPSPTPLRILGIDLNDNRPPLRIRFSQPVDPRAFQSNSAFAIRDSTNTTYTYLADLQPDLTTLLLYPDVPLGRQFRIDPSGPPLTNLFRSVTLESVPANSFALTSNATQSQLRITNTTPADGAANIPTNTIVVLEWNRTPGAANSTIEVSPSVPFSILPTNWANASFLRFGTPLAPNTRYQISVTGTSYSPYRFSFVTGDSPDLSPFRLLGRTTQAPNFLSLPANFKLWALTSRPVHPRSVDALSSQFLQRQYLNSSVSADGLSLLIEPGDSFLPGRYNYQFIALDPLSSATPTNPGGIAVVSAQPDFNPPTLLSSFPRPDSTLPLPLSGTMGLLFDEPVQLSPDSRLTLSANGQNVPITITYSDTDQTAIFLRPDAPLAPGTTYELRANSVADFAANASDPILIRFTTSGTRPPTAQLLSSSPAFDRTDVDPNTALEFKFSQPVNVSTLLPSQQLTRNNGLECGGTRGIPYRLSTSGDDTQVSLQPLSPLPPGSTCTFAPLVSDRTGNSVSIPALRFRTAGDPPPPTPLLPLSIDPPSGATIHALEFAVRMVFPQSLATASVNAASISVLGPTGACKVTRPPLPSDRTFVFTVSCPAPLPASGDYFVTIGGLADIYGNSLPSTQLTYSSPANPSSDLNPPYSVRLVKPILPALDATVDPNTDFVLAFSAPPDRASVEQSIQLSDNRQGVNGARNVPGTLTWSDDGLTVVFTPSTFLSPGTSALLTFTQGIRFPQGPTLDFQALFAVRSTPPPTAGLQVIANVPQGLDALAQPFDFAFSQSLTPAQQAALKLELSQTNSAQPSAAPVPIKVSVTFLTPSRARFRAEGITASSSPTNLQLQLTLNGESLFKSSYSTARLEQYRFRDRITAFPTNNSLNVPRNARVLLFFSTGLSNLVLPSQFQLLSSLGPVAFQFQRLNSSTLALTPLAVLPPNTTFTLKASGLEDANGAPLPSLTTVFTTSTSFDGARPVLLSQSPSSGIALGTEPITLRFSEPAAPLGNPADFLTLFGSPFPYSLELSDQGATWTLRPLTAWIQDRSVSLRIDPVSDLCGNLTASQPRTVNLPPGGGPAGTVSPAVTSTYPLTPASNLPRNAVFSFELNQPFQIASDDSSFVSCNDVPQPASFTSNDAGTRLRIAPLRPLPPNSACYALLGNVVLAGAQTAAINFRLDFTTSSTLDVTPPTAQSLAPNLPADLSLRLFFSKPVNPLSLFFNATQNGAPLFPPLTPVWDASLTQLTLQWTNPSRLCILPPYLLTLTVEDLAGNPLSLAANTSCPDSTPSEPLRLLSTSPAQGAVGVPAGNTLYLLFNNPAVVGATPNAIVLRAGDRLLPFSFSWPSPTRLVITPLVRLPLNSSIRLELNSLFDAQGNALPPATLDFSTVPADPGPAVFFRLLSSNPSANAIGWDVNAPITADFSLPLDATAIDKITVGQPGRGNLPIRITIVGTRITITPQPAWPANATLNVQIQVSDDLQQSGGPAFFSFTTQASSDQTPPTIDQVSPAEGDTLPPGPFPFLIRFSEPVTTNPAFDALVLSTLGATSILNFTIQSDGRTVIPRSVPPVTLRPSTNYQLTITDAFTDLSGNRLVPVSVNFSTSAAAASQSPTILSTTPAVGSTLSSTRAPLSLQFSLPMETVSTAAALVVSNANKQIPGNITFQNENRTLLFEPNEPYSPGTVALTVSPAARAASGVPFANTYLATYTLPQPTATLVSLRRSGATVLLRFDQPVSAHALDLRLRQDHLAIPIRVTQLSESEIALEPQALLRTGIRPKLRIAGQEFPWPQESEQ